jgi:RNA polymerase sigma-70 factor (ECF subfamily)
MVAADKAAPVLAVAHDVDLAALAKGGDRRAFSELVRRHGSAVRGLLRRLGADPGLADILARDAFLSAFEQIGEFRGDLAFQAWVKRIAGRLFARQWLRDNARRAKPGAAVADRASHAPGPAGLDGALTALPRAERVCVALCYGGGLSHAEVADALKLPLAAVKSHVRDGLDRLKLHLEPPTDDSASRKRVDG